MEGQSFQTKLLLNSVSVAYYKKKILNNISFELPSQKITAVMGQSGCGKSTLLKSVNRIVESDGGKITGEMLLDGESLLCLNPEILRKRVGLVFQNPVVFPCSVMQNILYTLCYHYPVKRKNRPEEAARYLKMAGLYEEVKEQLHEPASNLSGGQQQRLAIARCLCTQPEILMLDEPCSALDIKNTLMIEKLLQELKKQYTILIVTHNLVQAKRIADYVIFMENGEVVESSGAKEFFKAPKTDLAREYVSYMAY